MSSTPRSTASALPAEGLTLRATLTRSGWALAAAAGLLTHLSGCGGTAPARPVPTVDLEAVRARASAAHGEAPRRATVGLPEGRAEAVETSQRPAPGDAALPTALEPAPSGAARLNHPVTRAGSHTAPGRPDESPAAVCQAARRGLRQAVIEAVTAEAGLRVSSVFVDAQRQRTGRDGATADGFVDSFSVLSGQVVLLGEALTETPEIDPRTREQRCTVAGEVTVMAVSPEGRCRVEARLRAARGDRDDVQTVREGEALSLTLALKHASHELGLVVLTLDEAGAIAPLSAAPLAARAGATLSFPSAEDVRAGLELRPVLPEGRARSAESLLVLGLPLPSAHALLASPAMLAPAGAVGPAGARSSGDLASAFGRVLSEAMRVAPVSGEVCWDLAAYEILPR
jgi:hypothetical protein